MHCHDQSFQILGKKEEEESSLSSLNVFIPGLTITSSMDSSNGNGTIVDGEAFHLPSMQYGPGNETCVPYGSSEFRVYSFGWFAGEKPYTFPFPVLMSQIIAIMFLTRLVYFILRPIKQPRIVCDFLGGLLLSPPVLGLVKISFIDEVGDHRVSTITEFFYPTRDFSIIRSMACLGIMFYLFLTAVKIDLKLITQSGKKAWVIGFASLAIPFFLTHAGVYLMLNEEIKVHIARRRFHLFIIAFMSTTSFPVLADILMELNLLNSELGRLAMSSAMVHGVFGSIFMAAFVAINQAQGGWQKSLWSMLSLAVVVLVIVFVFRPWMQWIVKRTPKGGRVHENQIYAIFVSMIAMGIVSDSIGSSFAFAPFVMGLVVPDGPPLGAALVEKAHLLAGEGLMPLLFAVSGIHTNVGKLTNMRNVGHATMCFLLSYIGKVVSTMVSALYFRIHLQNGFLLGLMMNFRGMVEFLIILNFQTGALISDEVYTLNLLLMMIGTGVAAPIVTCLYKPLATSYNLGRRAIQHVKSHAELRILVCVQTESPIPSIINLLEASSPANEMPLCVYVLHLTQLVGRAISTLIAHKNKKGFINPSQMDRLHNVFISFEQNKIGHVAVQPFTSITPFKTMHQDICALAAQKSVALIVVPYPRKGTTILNDADLAILGNIPDIIAQASCSVGILVYPEDARLVSLASRQFQHHIGVLFWGGPDDREALAYASRMVCRLGVNLTVFHFTLAVDQRDAKDQNLDNNLLSTLQYDKANSGQLTVEVIMANDVEQTIQSIRSIGGSGFDLLLLGKRRGANSLIGDQLCEWSDFSELGVVGDMLASKDFEGSGSILVIQHQA